MLMYSKDWMKDLKFNENNTEAQQYGLTIPMNDYMGELYKQGRFRDEVYIQYPIFRKVGLDRRTEFDRHTVIMLGLHNNPVIDFPEHVNEEMEMMYVLEGHAINRVNDVEIIVSAGDCLITKKGARHSTRAGSKEDVTANIIIRDAFFDSQFMYYLTANPWFHTFYINPEAGYLHCRAYGDKDIALIMENLMCEFMSSDQLSVINIRMYLTLCLNLYYRKWKENEGKPYDASFSEELKLHELYRYIGLNIAGVSLKTLAEHFNYEDSYLSRFIQRHLGKSFTQLKQEMCVRRAVELLSKTDMPVSHIMKMVGYSNSDYFYKIFKKYLGMSPLDYRKRFKNMSREQEMGKC